LPIVHFLDEENRIIRFKVSGTLTASEMLAAIDRAMKDVENRTGFRVLSDHREITVPATTAQLKELVAHLCGHASSLAGTRWALIVGQLASFGMMRMLGVFAEKIPIEVRVFTDAEKAELWLTTIVQNLCRYLSVSRGTLVCDALNWFYLTEKVSMASRAAATSR
jgi:hypothetical protein